MVDNTLTQEVLILTFNKIDFPSSTEVPLEKILLIDPKNVTEVKRAVAKGNIKIVVIDGCIPFKLILDLVIGISAVRNRLKSNIFIYIVHQDQIPLRGTIWEPNPTGIKKYLSDKLVA